MADINDEQQSEVVRITGGDELFAADVIEENGSKKLLVKSTIVPQILGNRFVRYAEDGGSNDMAINGGAGTDFLINSDATGDLVVNSMVFEAIDGGIRMDRFLGKNAELTNGVLVEVKSQDVTFQFQPIKNTLEFDSLFSYGNGRSYQVIFASADDTMVTRFGPSTPFLIKQTGTYAIDDYIKIVIQDNLNSVTSFRFLAEGSIDV